MGQSQNKAKHTRLTSDELALIQKIGRPINRFFWSKFRIKLRSLCVYLALIPIVLAGTSSLRQFSNPTNLRTQDSGKLKRIQRYGLIFGLCLALVWVPAISYLIFGRIQYTSRFSLILPGAGSSSSINLAQIGQASSATNSAFGSAGLSPTVTYKNLIMSNTLKEKVASNLKIGVDQLSIPQVKLVDETSLIAVEIIGKTALDAKVNANAVLSAFLIELTRLRDDEIAAREKSTVETVMEYKKTVDNVRTQIIDLQLSTGLNSVEQFTNLVVEGDKLHSLLDETLVEFGKTTQAIDSLKSNLKITPSLAAVNLKLLADPEFGALADATAKSEAELSERTREFGPNHPKVVEAKSHFDGAYSHMLDRAKRVTGLASSDILKTIDFASSGQRPILLTQLVTLKSEEAGLREKVRTLESQLSEKRRQIHALTSTAAKFDGLNRDYKVAEAVFTSALARISTAKVDIFASYPMVQVVESATLPISPTSPNRTIALGAALAASLALTIGLFLGWRRKEIVRRLSEVRNFRP